MSEKLLGPMSVTGAAIGYILACFPHSWGGLSSYMISYHAQYTPDLNVSAFEWIYPTQIIGSATSFLLAPIITNYISNRKLALMMSILLSISIGQTIFTQSSLLTCFGFAYFSGFASGMIQIVCISPPTSYYPDSIGKISGILNGTLSVGLGLLIVLYKSICNPDNLKIDPITMAYPKEVTSNYPVLIFTIVIIFLVLGILNFLLMSQKHQKLVVRGEASVFQVVSTSQFWFALGLTFVLFHGNMFALSNYKVIGMKFINDDQKVTLAQTICVFGNLVGRSLWGLVCQRFGFKRVSFVVLNLLAVVFLLFPMYFESFYWFTCLGVIWFTLGSISYPGLLVYCNMKYGQKLASGVYGYLLLATAATTINIAFIKSIIPYIGYSGAFYAIGSLLLIGLGFNLQLNNSPYIFVKKSSVTSLL